MEAIRGSQKSLILVARQLGVHIGANDIPERFKIDDRELSLKEMCELAKSFDLKAKATKINEKDLNRMSSLYFYCPFPGAGHFLWNGHMIPSSWSLFFPPLQPFQKKINLK